MELGKSPLRSLAATRVRTFEDIDTSSPGIQEKLGSVNDYLAEALRNAAYSPERNYENPPYVDQPWGTGNPNEVVDPSNPRELSVASRLKAEGCVLRPDNGHPVNPYLDRGVNGRGDNNLWGPDWAGDAHVLRVGPDSKQLEVLVGKRRDNGKFATPGGMFDSRKDQTLADTIGRELQEETGLELDFHSAEVSYRGYALNAGDTNNAWRKTECHRVLLTPEQAQALIPKAGDDLKEGSARFEVAEPGLLDDMHDLHGQQLTFTIEALLAQNPALADCLHPDMTTRLRK